MTENHNNNDPKETSLSEKARAAIARARERARQQALENQSTPAASEIVKCSAQVPPISSEPSRESLTINGREIYPEWRVDVHIYCFDEDLGIEVPVGCEWDGEWSPIFLGFMQSSFVMDDDEFAEFLATEDGLGAAKFDYDYEAVEIFTETRKRWFRLAREKANQLASETGEMTPPSQENS